jgi:hemin uptake protein HemP
MTESAASTPPADVNPAAEPPRFDSSTLFQGSRIVVIMHAGETYRLLLTRNNGLILQK